MVTDSEPKLVVTAICGGDPAAVKELVRKLPARAGVTCLICCSGAAKLSESLRALSQMPIVVVRDGATLVRDHIYVLPEDQEISLDARGIVTAAPNGHGNVDRLLRSIAEYIGANSIAVILGGSGSDGVLGLKRIKENGGVVICESVGQGTLAELPRSAIESGFVDLTLCVEQIAERVVQLSAAPAATALVADEPVPQAATTDSMRDILAMLRIRTGNDFSAYKRATLHRRISRRMQVCETDTAEAYFSYLREHPHEVGNLLRDFLISVTNFFRDPQSFDVLAHQVIPQLLHGKSPSDQLRVWVAGCATGEEAYSVAILLVEAARRLAHPPSLQVFATDIDEAALAQARDGIYPAAIGIDVSRERLERFFTRENESYRVSQELREMMLFSAHNVLRDPPFSRLDLVSSRNLLIYLNRQAQERVLGTFHFALRPDGFLFLGSSESVENTSQFGPFNAKSRIFQRRPAPSSLPADTLIPTTRWHTPRLPLPVTDRHITSFGELHHRVVEQYAPPSVLVNDDLDVVHISEHAGKYMSVHGGEPTRQVLRLVHESLRFELRGAIYAAQQSPRGSDTRVVRFDQDGRSRTVELRVRSIDSPEQGRRSLLILFDELDEPTTQLDPPDPKLEPIVRQMEQELDRTRDQLRTTVEQYESSLEELKASNEELQAINEEFRSATEELETGKEELQSLNEELTTLNHELNDKLDELSRANSDIQNLMTSTDIAVVFLDRKLQIKRFTSRAQHVFNLIPADVGRPFAHVTHRFEDDDVVATAAQVLDDLRSVERTLTAHGGRCYLARFLPYRSIEDRIEGIVMTFIDVTELEEARQAQQRSEAELRTIEDRLAFALRAAPVAVIVRDANLVTTWAFVHGRQLASQSREPFDIFAPGHGERFDRAAREVLESRTGKRVELELGIEGEVCTYDFRIEVARVGDTVGVTAVGFDISPSKHAEASLIESDRRKDEFLAMLSHELRNPLTPLRVAFEVLRRPDAGAAKAAMSMSIMDTQLELLTRLVDDLLDVSRITQGKVQLEIGEVDLVSVVETALQATRPLIDDAHHVLSVELPRAKAIVLGDFGRLTQVVTNLMTNAAKYTPNGGKLAVEIILAAGTAVIRVRDNGVGIGVELMPRVFEIFVQSRDELGRSRGGLGIGLNLVRRLVELHGGRVYVESAGPHQGSCFTIELPLIAGKA